MTEEELFDKLVNEFGYLPYTILFTHHEAWVKCANRGGTGEMMLVVRLEKRKDKYGPFEPCFEIIEYR